MLNDYLKEGRKQPLIPCNWSHVIKSAIGYIISHDSDKCKICENCYLEGEKSHKEIKIDLPKEIINLGFNKGGDKKSENTIIPEIIDENKLKQLIGDLKEIIKHKKNQKNIDNIFKIKNVFNKIKNKYKNVDDNFNNEKIEDDFKSNIESKFDIYKHYFKKKDYITADFINYLIKCIFIPHKTHEYYIKKKYNKKIRKNKI